VHIGGATLPQVTTERRKVAIRVGLHAPFIFGPVGFARVGRMIALGLNDLGIEVRLTGVTSPRYDRLITKEDYERLKSFAQQDWEPNIWISLSPGCGFLKDVEGWNISMSMWETPVMPGFGRHCKQVDEVWVPSPFNWKVFHESETSSVPKERLSYMPLGVDTTLYSPHPPSIRITDDFQTDFDFVYGIVCGYSARKGVDLMLTAHHELFDQDSNVALFVKGDYFGQRLLPRDMQSLYSGNMLVDLSGEPEEVQKQIESKVHSHKPVVLYNFDGLSDAELSDVYNALDAFVFPSRGEGFGLPPLEAMSCELPVIGTAATGMEPFMLESICYPIRSKGWKVCSACDWITPDYHGHLFADPDYMQYRDAVWEVYSNRGQAKAKGVKARKFAVANYRFEVVTRRMKERLEEIMGGKQTTENFWPPTEGHGKEG